MIFQLLGLVAVFVATFHVYRTARDNGRSGAGWASATFGVGIGFQWILPIILGIVLAVIWIATGSSIEELQESLLSYALILNFVCLGLSFVGMFLILRHVAKLPEEPEAVAPPPPPPTFENNNQ